MPKILLREISNCNCEQKNTVREIRNQESVRKSMYTDHMILVKEHESWLEKIKNDSNQIVFVVFADGIICGVVSINFIDRIHFKSDWAFYLDENYRGGLGAVLEFSILNFVFMDLGLEKLNCEVIETNEAVIKLHKKFGFKEEGYRRENILKNNRRIGVFFLGLTKSDWEIIKESVRVRYEKLFSKFNLVIEYEPA